MTNLEAVKSTVGVNYPLDANVYLKAMIDAGLEPDTSYVKASAKAVDLAAASLILTLLTSADVQEGGYRVSIADRANLVRVRKTLLAKYGIPDGSGAVISAAPTYLW